MEEKKFNAKLFAIILIIFVIAVVMVSYFLLSDVFEKDDDEESASSRTSRTSQEEEPAVQGETKEVKTVNEYAIKDNNFSKFDFAFLKFENEKENKIYSPLSIKYAFKMLEEGTTGDSHDQIADIVGAYNLTEYESNNKMALANAIFIRDDYRDNIKESYINALRTKYNATVEFDTFSSANNINLWVKGHTLNLIPDLLQDSDVTDLNFALVNALGIDMDWEHKFLKHDYSDDSNISSGASYPHERIEGETYQFEWHSPDELVAKKFDGNQKASSMQVLASFNNYDIMTELGEDKIRETVYEDFKEWALKNKEYESYSFNNDFSEANIRKVFDDWFDNTKYPEYGYINLIKQNYGKAEYSTDFELYVDDTVKVFAKDLEEVNGTTLQYVGIMPIKDDLDEFIAQSTNTDIANYIDSLKELKSENFKDGYITYIHGYIPKFEFEYELNLKEDLEKMGVTDVFEQGKAKLTKITDDKDVYIDTAKHKANIEFTQDGIKAAAATMALGWGAGDWYDYFFEIPTENIDITFDKPYMFLVRDKVTGETWFVGTVYEPLNPDDDTTQTYMYDAWEDRENTD